MTGGSPFFLFSHGLFLLWKHFLPFASFLCTLCCALPPSFFPSLFSWLPCLFLLPYGDNNESTQSRCLKLLRSLVGWASHHRSDFPPSPNSTLSGALWDLQSACLHAYSWLLHWTDFFMYHQGKKIYSENDSIGFPFYITGNKITKLLTERALAHLNHKSHWRRLSHTTLPSTNASHKPVQTWAHFRYF